MTGINSLLATGGLTAAFVAGWQYVKSIANYCTSFAVITAQLDDGFTMPLRTHLKLNYRALPSGKFYYLSRFLTLKGKKNTALVPFHVSANTVIYVKGWRILLMTLQSNGLSLMSIRGMFNFDDLVRSAILEYEARSEQKDKLAARSRFQVIRVMGSEKGPASNTKARSGSDRGDSLEASVTSAIGSHVAIDLSVDESFMYAREEYTSNPEVDPFANLFYSQEIQKYIDQAVQWMNMGDWYLERNIPWRRGWLMYGTGGTGKSSLAKATAQKLRIPIYQYFLGTLSDQEFIAEWDSMNTPCIALFEDFDAIFKLRESLTEHRMLTFDCVLNQISGVASTNGVFLMVSTNHLENIDPAMGVECGKDGISTRPGRIDSVIYVGLMDRDNRYRLANQILRDWPEEIEALVNKSDDVTPIQFQEMCIQIAFQKLAELPKTLKLVSNA